jgi:alpha-tubulin suppressor-like RCC1 family protein
MRKVFLCGMALSLVLFFFSIPADADDLTVLTVASYGRERELKLSGGWWMYSFKMSVKNAGKLPLSGVCGQVRSTSSSVKVIDPEVCFPDIPAGGSAPSKGTFTIWTNKRLAASPTSLSWTYSSLKITTDPSPLAIQQGTRYNALTYYVTLSTSAPKKYYVLFHQTVPKGITVTENSFLTREISRSDTWQVSEYVSAPAAMSSQITARAWILNTLQQAETTVPVTVTPGPPPPQLGTLGSWPDALQVGVEATVRFSIPISGTLPASLTLEQQDINRQWHPLVPSVTLTDSGPPGDIQAGDALYGGVATLTPSSEGTLLFRASSPTGASAPYTLTVIPSSFPIGAAPTDFQKVITPPSGQKVVGNRLLVRFRGTNSDTISAILNTINGTVVGYLGAINYYHVEIPTSDQNTLFAALLTLRASPDVLAAQPDFVGEGSKAPNDPYYAATGAHPPGQWGMRATGANNAWDLSSGQGVKVAVIDYGVDPTHKEFLVNPSQPSSGSRVTPCIIQTNASGNHSLNCPTCTITVNGVIYGLDCPAATNPDLGMTGSAFLDLMREGMGIGHGTQVAGVIGAKGDNGIGIAGMAWNSDILAIKACFDPSGGNQGGCATSAVAHAITAARSLDARIINLSLYTSQEHYNTTTQQCDPPVLNIPQEIADDQAIRDAVENASSSTLIVVAAGNYAAGEEENTCKTYPAGHPKALAVGAVKRNPDESTLAIWDTSRRGDWVDLAAPGEAIWTLGPNSIGGTFATGKDTSIAAPFVSGAAALLWQYYAPQDSALSINDIKTRILLSARTIGSLPVENNRFLNVNSAFTMARLSQTISVTTEPPSAAVYNSTPFTVAAMGGPSDNPVVITTSGGCSGGGDNSASITMTSGTDACTIRFNQADNINYNAATEATRSVAAQPATQATLTIGAPTSLTYGGDTGTLSATGGSGTGGVTYSAGTSTGCSISGTTLSVTNASGTCQVTATKAGDGNYSEITSAGVTVGLERAAQATLTTIVTPSTVTYGNTATLSATGGSGTGAVTYSAGASTGCSVSGSTLSVTNTSGGCLVTATKAGDGNYEATSAVGTVALQKAAGSISISNIPAIAPYGMRFTPAFTKSGDGTASVVSNTTDICTVASGVVNYVGAGDCILQASVAEGTNHLATTGTPQSLTIFRSEGKPIAAGYFHSVAVASDGTLRAWGWNDSGQVGDAGLPGNRLVPVQISTESTWVSLTAGGYHSLALKLDGSLWGWGYNGDGEVGDGTANNLRWSPVPSATDSAWVAVSAGGLHTMALKSDRTLWGWGNNHDGKLGDGTLDNRAYPVSPIGTGTWTWLSLCAGGYHTVFVKSDGTLWALGSNGWGQIGDGTTTDSLYPVQVGEDNTWISVSAGNLHTAALKSDGTLWAWGDNGFGKLGDGTNVQRLSPVQIGTDDTWVSVSAGQNHTAALKSDGTLWAWGGNYYGQVGDGTTTDRSSPVQIDIGNQWISVSAGSDHTVALKSDGTLWSWGSNEHGQLGNGTTDDRYLPAPVLAF